MYLHCTLPPLLRAHAYRISAIVQTRWTSIHIRVGMCARVALGILCFCVIFLFRFSLTSFLHSIVRSTIAAVVCVCNTPLHSYHFYWCASLYSSLFHFVSSALSFSRTSPLSDCIRVESRSLSLCRLLFQCSLFHVGSHVGIDWRMFSVGVFVVPFFPLSQPVSLSLYRLFQRFAGAYGGSSSGMVSASPSRNWFTVKQLHHLVLECWERSIRVYFGLCRMSRRSMYRR